MLYLPKPNRSKVKEFYDKLIKRILAAKSKSGLSDEAKAFLTEERIKEIICAEPDKLLNLHSSILHGIDNVITREYYNSYLQIKKRSEDDRSEEEQNQFLHCNSIIDDVKSIFDYNKFISGHKVTSYWLSNLLSRNTCTYCNRLYTSYVAHRDERTNRINDSTRITRPFFDHWFSRSKYPALALSFFNLIPSCSICNSSVKLDQEFGLNTHVHPYMQEIDQEFSFDFISKSVHENNVKVVPVSGIGATGKTRGLKISKTLKDFKIKEIYNSHSELELKDLLELRYKYSNNYLDTLFTKTFLLDVKKEEAYRLIFGTEYDIINHHKRPFSKFKRDILEKLGVNTYISKL